MSLHLFTLHSNCVTCFYKLTSKLSNVMVIILLIQCNFLLLIRCNERQGVRVLAQNRQLTSRRLHNRLNGGACAGAI